MDIDVNMIIEKAKHFLEVAKEVQFDPAALYEKEPMIMQIIAGVVVFILLIVMMIIKGKMRRASAQKALSSLDSYIETFDEYQANLRKILKSLPSAKADFIEALQEKKEEYYTEQLRTLRELSLEEKIDKYQEMAALYKELSLAAKNEELREFYAHKATQLLEDELYNEISTYMQSFNFTPEDVATLEKIVAYANAQEDGDAVLSLIMKKLESVDFGSSLEIFTFVRELDADKLGEIYTYCTQQQDKLFENGERVVAGDVLEYLLENNEADKVIAYVKSLKVPTHLQELYYRFFNQKGNQELDFAFIANPLSIQQDYKNYVEELVTKHWREDKVLEKLLEYANIQNVIGHDRVRIVMERIDDLRKLFDEKKMAQEALNLAKEAHKIAMQTKELVAPSAKQPQPQTEKEEQPQEESQENKEVEKN